MQDKDIKFEHYDFDRLSEGSQINIEHTVYYDGSDNGNDISELISKPLADVLAMKDESIVKETAAYEKVRQAAYEWEKQAAITARFDKAVDYLKTPAAEHSHNKWVDKNNDYRSISNMVYKMDCRIYEGYSWRSNSPKWEVYWVLYTNTPRQGFNKKIAGQDKSYATKEEAEKYLQGRIKAYSHLFTEISPPIPNEYVNNFCVSGQLLRGYTTEAMQKEKAEQNPPAQKKTSIRQQLNTLKEQQKAAPSKPKSRQHKPQEIG